MAMKKKSLVSNRTAAKSATVASRPASSRPVAERRVAERPAQISNFKKN
jgi:hypothetical protein